MQVLPQLFDFRVAVLGRLAGSLIEAGLLPQSLGLQSQSANFVSEEPILKLHLSDVVLSFLQLLREEIVLFRQLLVEIVHVAEVYLPFAALRGL